MKTEASRPGRKLEDGTFLRGIFSIKKKDENKEIKKYD